MMQSPTPRYSTHDHQGKARADSTFKPCTGTVNSNVSMDNTNSEQFHQSEESHWSHIENMDKHRISDTVFVPGQRSEFKPKPPKFSGQPDMLEPFLMKMQFMSRHYKWSEEQFRNQLIFSLEGEALKFVSCFPLDVIDNTDKLLELLYHRFGQCTIPGIYRDKLNQIQKLETETIQEYSGRISQLMSRAYPDMQGTNIYQNIAIQYMLKGLPDQSLAYEIYIQKPVNLIQAAEMLDWQIMCRSFTHNSSCDSKKSSSVFTETASIPQLSRDINFSAPRKTDRSNPMTQTNVCYINQRERKCYRCRLRGHMADMCPTLLMDPPSPQQ